MRIEGGYCFRLLIVGLSSLSFEQSYFVCATRSPLWLPSSVHLALLVYVNVYFDGAFTSFYAPEGINMLINRFMDGCFFSNSYIIYYSFFFLGYHKWRSWKTGAVIWQQRNHISLWSGLWIWWIHSGCSSIWKCVSFCESQCKRESIDRTN